MKLPPGVEVVEEVAADAMARVRRRGGVHERADVLGRRHERALRFGRLTPPSTLCPVGRHLTGLDLLPIARVHVRTSCRTAFGPRLPIYAQEVEFISRPLRVGVAGTRLSTFRLPKTV